MPKILDQKFEQWIDSRAHYWLKLLQKTSGLKSRLKGNWVDVQLFSEKQMAELNLQYLGKNYPTDVLSFLTAAEFESAGLVGALAICLPVLKKQALENGHSDKKEADVLLVHGLLHLAGFDHEGSAGAEKKFRTLEAKFLPKKGLVERQSSGTDTAKNKVRPNKRKATKVKGQRAKKQKANKQKANQKKNKKNAALKVSSSKRKLRK